MCRFYICNDESDSKLKSIKDQGRDKDRYTYGIHQQQGIEIPNKLQFFFALI